MNIFRILSSKDGNLYEPSITSFLAYLLNLQGDHGMGQELLRSLILDFQDNGDKCFEELEKKFLAYDISVESEYSVYTQNNEKKDVDIVVKFAQDDKVKYILCIENKIKDSSLNKDQLLMELEGIEREYAEEDELPKILFCFLTLKPSRISAECFAAISCCNKSAIHLFWVPSNHRYSSIYEKIQNIIAKSDNGEIDPISSDVRFIITSFLVFMKHGFKSEEMLKKHIEEERERQSYKKSVMQYIREYAETLEPNKEISFEVAKESISKMIEDFCGFTPNKKTIYGQLTTAIVNNRTRIHHGVTQENQRDFNLFYYPNEKDHSVIQRYVEGKSKVDYVYLK